MDTTTKPTVSLLGSVTETTVQHNVTSLALDPPVCFDDGGRAAAGFKGVTGDCVTRAIAIATGKPYSEVYNELHTRLGAYAASHRDRAAKSIARGGGASPRNGVYKKVYRPYLEELGWAWHPTMQIGSGCTVHLRHGELPTGALIVEVSKHLVAVINGTIHDTYDCSRGGTRCVYGYYTAGDRTLSPAPNLKITGDMT